MVTVVTGEVTAVVEDAGVAQLAQEKHDVSTTLLAAAHVEPSASLVMTPTANFKYAGTLQQGTALDPRADFHMTPSRTVR